ncbi:MarR family transcriptional regulator [Acetobacter sp. AN02]|uniref:MarR family winged helix-turn-helix transcriptional regulator n=1 Tax=Acetobacter sp. AN02 TaxID=2894186 RepID=UPI00243444CD|nr:MarR family transcriptional regulator [Acetobacter sp. AN02]MDG6093666.1 MarR family transcriptional regulator [Acetobacter sp. AN02]
MIPSGIPGTGRREQERLFSLTLVRLAAAWRREIDHDLSSYGLTDASWRPLFYLDSLPPPVRQTDLARAMSVEAPSLVRLLVLLEKKELISRQPDPDDRRARIVSLTARGRSIAAAVVKTATDISAQLLGNVSSRQLTESLSTFACICETMQARRADASQDTETP